MYGPLKRGWTLEGLLLNLWIDWPVVGVDGNTLDHQIRIMETRQIRKAMKTKHSLWLCRPRSSSLE
jgi:hypothetical protein